MLSVVNQPERDMLTLLLFCAFAMQLEPVLPVSKVVVARHKCSVDVHRLFLSLHRFNHFTKTPLSFLPYRQEDKRAFQRQRRNGNVLLVHIAPQHGNIGGVPFTIGPQNIKHLLLMFFTNRQTPCLIIFSRFCQDRHYAKLNASVLGCLISAFASRRLIGEVRINVTLQQGKVPESIHHSMCVVHCSPFRTTVRIGIRMLRIPVLD